MLSYIDKNKSVYSNWLNICWAFFCTQKGRFIMNKITNMADKFLSQAKNIDKRIETKKIMLERHRDMAAKCTATLSDMPKNMRVNSSNTEGGVCKMFDIERDFLKQLDRLMSLKKKIINAINAVSDTELQLILEQYYICDMTWNEIAKGLHYSERQLYRLRDKALEAVNIPEK